MIALYYAVMSSYQGRKHKSRPVRKTSSNYLFCEKIAISYDVCVMSCSEIYPVLQRFSDFHNQARLCYPLKLLFSVPHH